MCKRNFARSSEALSSRGGTGPAEVENAVVDSRDLYCEEYARYGLDELQRQGDNRHPTPSPLRS